MFNFQNSYSHLPAIFFSPANPDKVASPALIEFNQEFAKGVLGLDLDGVTDQELAEIFTGQVIPKNADPIALAYAGHQFGHFVPQLGDGRAILLGEVVTPKGRRYDLQFKGSGRTPFSRNGDGKSSLGPVIREYIVSEAMHFLGVPTTRALAAAATGDMVYREEALPGGIFTRVASSHIRIGTLEFFGARSDIDSLKILTDYAIDRHYPEIKTEENLYLAFIRSVAQSHAALVAKWMSFGFIHGVMNTDNMSISGETIDYGPCAFMDNFAADRVYSSIDRHGRYAYNNQIPIAKWNLFKLASCLLPLIHKDEEEAIRITEESINSYIRIYEEKWLESMSKKLGLFDARPEDEALINQWLKFLEDEDLDFTVSFRQLAESANDLKDHSLFKDFSTRWNKRLDAQPQSLQDSIELMNHVNPVFIPRNHQVERAIQSALKGDYSVFREMNELLKAPFVDQEQFVAYKEAPKPEERIKGTFCGT